MGEDTEAAFPRHHILTLLGEFRGRCRITQGYALPSLLWYLFLATPVAELTSSTSSLPGSEVCFLPCWAHLTGWRWNKGLALASYQNGISLALGPGEIVLCQSQMAPDGTSCSPLGAFATLHPGDSLKQEVAHKV